MGIGIIPLSILQVCFQDSLKKVSVLLSGIVQLFVALILLGNKKSSCMCWWLTSSWTIGRCEGGWKSSLCTSVGAPIAIWASLIPSVRLSPAPHDNWFTAITSNLLLLLLLLEPFPPAILYILNIIHISISLLSYTSSTTILLLSFFLWYFVILLLLFLVRSSTPPHHVQHPSVGKKGSCWICAPARAFFCSLLTLWFSCSPLPPPSPPTPTQPLKSRSKPPPTEPSPLLPCWRLRMHRLMSRRRSVLARPVPFLSNDRKLNLPKVSYFSIMQPFVGGG